MIKTYCLILLLVATTMMSVAEANLISNGGFETGDFTGWTQFGNTEFSEVDNLTPHSGTYGAFFGPTVVNGYGGIEQSFATVIGEVYNLDFWLQDEADSLSVTKPNSFEVSITGSPITSLFSLTDAPAFSYRNFTASFTADSVTTTLKFTFQHDPNGWDLDDVSVLARSVSNVPEPSTWTLLGMGLLALSMSVRSTRTAQ
jgi:hypothetical protein